MADPERNRASGQDDVTRYQNLSADDIDRWIVAARIRVADLQYQAINRGAPERAYAVAEMSSALADAMDELRVTSQELRRTSQALVAASATRDQKSSRTASSKRRGGSKDG